MVEHNLGFPTDVYAVLTKNEFVDASYEKQIADFCTVNNFSSVLIYGSKSSTGMFVKKALGDRFYCFTNTDTIDENAKLKFDAIILGVSPQHYPAVLKTLRNIVPASTHVVLLFEGEPTKRKHNDILVFGDSHSKFFLNKSLTIAGHYLNFIVHHVGPALASSMADKISVTMARNYILSTLKHYTNKNFFWIEPQSKFIVLTFGEIDCRSHILTRISSFDYENDFRPVGQSVIVSVHRYFSFIIELRLLGFMPIVWAPIASSAMPGNKPGNRQMITCDGVNFPLHGSPALRNRITKLFNTTLRNLCQQQGIPFLSVFDQMLTSEGLTKPELLPDGYHLDEQSWPEASRLFANLLSELLLDTEQDQGMGLAKQVTSLKT